MAPIEKTSIIAHPPAVRVPAPAGWRRFGRLLLRHGRRAVAGLPSDCPLCGLAARGGDLCAGCAADLAGVTGEAASRCPHCWLALPGTGMRCPDCAGRPPAFARTVAAFDYAAPVDGLVLALKNGMRLGRAAMLGRLLAAAVRAEPALPFIQALVPVPASRASLRRRGFNPAAEIARALGRELALPVHPQWLARTRESGKQSRLGRAGRRRGADGLYRCPQVLPGIWVAVVDDVMTTGSTQDAAAAALLEAGAAGVVALAAARTPYDAAEGV